MARRTRILAGLALTTLLALALIHRTGSEKGAAAQHARGDAEKERIRQFWKLNGEANRLRLEGNLEGAADLYRQSLDLHPAHEDSLYYLGLSLEGIGEFEEAASCYRRMTELNPLSNRAFAELGRVLATPEPGARLDFEGADKAFQRCLDLNREHSGPYLNLGRLRLNEGRFAEALEYFKIAAQYGSPEGNLLAGYTCFLQGQEKISREFLQRILDWYVHERRISERGAVLEGNLFSTTKGSPSPQENLAIQAALYRFWVAPGDLVRPSEEALITTLRSRFSSGDSWRETGKKLGLAGCSGRTAWADYDHDARVDLVSGSRDGSVRLYHNTPGGFIDSTKNSGLKALKAFWDAAWGDYDSDSLLDLYVIHSGFVGRGESYLYRNNGNGTFAEVGRETGLAGERSTFRAFFTDLEQDGHPELIEFGAASPGIPSIRVFHYEQGRWSDQAAARGLDVEGTIADCSPGDYDRDGDIDLFVYRWGRSPILFRNDSGRFTDVTDQAGLGGNRSTGFSSLFFDYDQDGFPDLLVTTHAPFADTVRSLVFPGVFASTLRLFRNLKNGRFEEVSGKLGLTGSFGTIEARATDLNGDGWPDLILANGSLDPLRVEPSVILRNVNGRAFELSTLLPSMERPANFVGVSTPDLDGDGHPEICFGTSPAFTSTPFRGEIYKHR